jgi:UMF1 family MFS transporter
LPNLTFTPLLCNKTARLGAQDRKASVKMPTSDPKNRRAVWAWALYDWANSAFATTVMAGFFPIFFKQFWSYGADVNLSTARLGLGNALAGLLVALAAPVLGAIADRGAARKSFLARFAALGVVSTALLFFVGQGQWIGAIMVYTAAIVGFSGANVFYDALLPHVAPRGQLERISAFGFAAGYLGGGLLFLLNVVMTLKPTLFGLSDSAAAVRWSFLTVAVWWGGFSLLSLCGFSEPPVQADRLSTGASIRFGLGRLMATLKQVRRYKPVFLFLLAYWFYIDGVDTIIRMAVDYGLSLGFDTKDLITALLLVQFIGFPAALAFGRLGEVWGVRRSIYLALVIYVGITLWGAFMQQRWEFFGLAAAVGLVQGGIQALSRSYFASLVPMAHSAEFFGLYNMMGKFAVIIGPAMMGLVGLGARRLLLEFGAAYLSPQAAAHIATRIGMASVAALFVIGGCFFFLANRALTRPSSANPGTAPDEAS